MLLELLELLGALAAHEGVAELARELHVDLPREISDLRGQHVRRDHRRVRLIALLAPVTRRLILHLLSALGATVVDHLVVVFDGLNEAGDHVELGLLLDGLAVAVPSGLLEGLVGLHRVDHLLDQLEVVLSLRPIGTLTISACSHGRTRTKHVWRG